MLKPRYIRQRQMTGLSLSLLLHAGAAIAISLAPTKLRREPIELPAAVYLEDSGAALPRGEQTEALPAAGATADTQSARTEQTSAGDNTPVAIAAPPAATEGEVVVPAKIVETKPVAKELPKKAELKKLAPPPATLPAKATVAEVTASSQDQDHSVNSAREGARNEKTQDLQGVETDEQAEERAQETLAQTEAEPQTEEEQEETLAPVAATAPETHEQPAEQHPATEAAAEPAAQPAQGFVRRVAPAQNFANQTSASGSTNAVGGIGSSRKFGIRDAEDLKAMPGNRAPVYPERDRLMRNQGTVVFVARVQPDGTVTEVQLERGTNSRSLDLSALEAMKKWRFLPGQQGMVRKGFTFSLGGEAEELPARLRR